MEEEFESIYHDLMHPGTFRERECEIISATASQTNYVISLLTPFIFLISNSNLHEWYDHLVQQKFISEKKRSPFSKKQRRIIIRRLMRDAERQFYLNRIIDLILNKVKQENQYEPNA